MLTAKGEEEDKIKGLESGVDDYITKPYSIKYDNFSSSSASEIVIFSVRIDNGFGPLFNSNKISALSGSNNDSRIFSFSFEVSSDIIFILGKKIIILSLNHVKIIRYSA